MAIPSLFAHCASVAALTALMAVPSVSFAQSPNDEGDATSDDAPKDEASKDDAESAGAGEARGGDAQGDDDAKTDGASPGGKSANDPYEDPTKRYNFIGLRFRDVIVPKFIINIFADGGATVNVFTFGPEFATRKDGMEIDIALSYADYSMDPFLFKGKNDNATAWERVESSLKVVYATLDLLWDLPLDKQGRFSFLVGGGVGIGGVFGGLKRNQVKPRPGVDPSGSEQDNADWENCSATEPRINGTFCDATNEHYGDYEEPSWANGGSKPVVYPWLAIPHLAFRYKPVKQFAARADVGFNIFSGFYFGLSAAYGL